MWELGHTFPGKEISSQRKKKKTTIAILAGCWRTKLWENVNNDMGRVEKIGTVEWNQALDSRRRRSCRFENEVSRKDVKRNAIDFPCNRSIVRKVRFQCCNISRRGIGENLIDYGKHRESAMLCRPFGEAPALVLSQPNTTQHKHNPTQHTTRLLSLICIRHTICLSITRSQVQQKIVFCLNCDSISYLKHFHLGNHPLNVN